MKALHWMDRYRKEVLQVSTWKHGINVQYLYDNWKTLYSYDWTISKYLKDIRLILFPCTNIVLSLLTQLDWYSRNINKFLFALFFDYAYQSFYTSVTYIKHFLEASIMELFIHGKAMVPYEQLSTNCRRGC